MWRQTFNLGTFVWNVETGDAPLETTEITGGDRSIIVGTMKRQFGISSRY